MLSSLGLCLVLLLAHRLVGVEEALAEPGRIVALPLSWSIGFPSR